ncbi:uncharacterized protein LOC144010976 [Festucalex cinctus]
MPSSSSSCCSARISTRSFNTLTRPPAASRHGRGVQLLPCGHHWQNELSTRILEDRGQDGSGTRLFHRHGGQDPQQASPILVLEGQSPAGGAEEPDSRSMAPLCSETPHQGLDLLQSEASSPSAARRRLCNQDNSLQMVCSSSSDEAAGMLQGESRLT